ncbi:MAG TPA: zinc ribbon domain-containing protein [Candidatus Binataceae bacterium]|nr:zinc ribbon domain-containing protein [Candidatus Binataceae bacterium]
MPIYEYKCPKCGVVEVTQRITEAPLKKCPNCKSKVERMISRSSFVLKGTGWYATDYANKGKNNASESSEKASSSNGSSSETKSESKSESKPSAESKPASSKSASSDKPSSAKSAD